MISKKRNPTVTVFFAERVRPSDFPRMETDAFGEHLPLSGYMLLELNCRDAGQQSRHPAPKGE